MGAWPRQGGATISVLLLARLRATRAISRAAAWATLFGTIVVTLVTTIGVAEPLLPLWGRLLALVVVGGASLAVAAVHWIDRVGPRRAERIYEAYPMGVVVAVLGTVALPDTSMAMTAAAAAVLAVVVAVSRLQIVVLGTTLLAGVPLVGVARDEVSSQVAVLAVLSYVVVAATVHGLREALVRSLEVEVVERARSRARADVLAVVAQGARVSSLSQIGEVHSTIVELATTLGWDMAVLYGVRNDDVLDLAAQSGVPEAFQLERMHRGEGLSGRALERAETVVTADYDSFEGAATGPTAGTVGTAVATPVWAANRMVGVLTAASARRGEPDPADLRALEVLASYAGRAIEVAERDAFQRRTIEELKRVETLKDDFLSTVSHEIRTPITVILGGTETLHERWEQLTEQQRRRLVDQAYSSAHGLQELITTLLDFTRLEAGELLPMPRETDLGDIATQVVERLATLTAHQHVELRMDGHGDLAVHADPVLVRQVVENLLSNAAKYAGVDARVTVAVTAEGGAVHLSVVDDGPGIQPAELARIGERFFRGGDALTRSTRGVGIGLSFCRQVLELHGSRLEVASSPGRGARFWFTLPSARPTDGVREGAG